MIRETIINDYDDSMLYGAEEESYAISRLGTQYEPEQLDSSVEIINPRK